MENIKKKSARFLGQIGLVSRFGYLDKKISEKPSGCYCGNNGS